MFSQPTTSMQNMRSFSGPLVSTYSGTSPFNSRQLSSHTMSYRSSIISNQPSGNLQNFRNGGYNNQQSMFMSGPLASGGSGAAAGAAAPRQLPPPRQLSGPLPSG